jgi:hypothetical protein
MKIHYYTWKSGEIKDNVYGVDYVHSPIISTTELNFPRSKSDFVLLRIQTVNWWWKHFTCFKPLNEREKNKLNEFWSRKR